MPHATMQLLPGADQNETPVLNQSGASVTNLIRYIPDRRNGALAQKIGGWTKYNSLVTPAITRALCAWEDTNAATHLAYGTQNDNTGRTYLGVITNGNSVDITPRNSANSSATLVASATAGSPLVTITDSVITGITDYDSVYIPVHISIGGIVLFGMYPCDPNGYIGASTYTVAATDVLGNLIAATSTTTTAYVPQISTVASSSITTVVLNNHGYSVGSTFPILVPTTVGGSTFSGQYIVTGIVDPNTFTINASTLPSATASAYVNGGNAYYIYSFGVGAIPAGTGYGVGGYGRGGYGSGTAVVPSGGTPIDANDWTLANWGEVLISCPSSTDAVDFRPIYQWEPLAGSPTATVIPQAPPVNDGMFVAMPQRQIVAWGSTFNGVQDPLLIRWCDVGNFSSWIGTVTNQAGSYRIPKGARIVGCLQAPQQGLIWTDIGLWSMQYTGLPYVYGFNEIGNGCGLISRKAAGTLGGVVYWMGPSQFFALSSEGVVPVQCPIWDVIFQDLDQSNLSKIRIAINSRFNEVTWYYPTMSSGGEVTAYVKFNPVLNAWDFGNLGRTAWVDQSVIGPPVGADPVSRYLYQHETSTDADGAPINASLQTGYFAIGDGENMIYVDQVWPDMKWGYYGGAQNATINMTFSVVNYPGDTPQVFGPYTITSATEYISPRFRGRLMSVTVSSDDTGSFWRMGGIRYQYKPDGRY